MYIFRSIHEIINTVAAARGLLTEMFEKRKILSFRYSDALALLKDDENRLKLLIEKEVIHQNGNFVELDARFMDFFELLLEANEEINTAVMAWFWMNLPTSIQKKLVNSLHLNQSSYRKNNLIYIQTIIIK